MPRGRGSLHRGAGFVGKREQAIGIAEQHLPAGARCSRLPSRMNSDDAEVVLELPDPRRDIGLHAVQLFRRARDAAFAYDGA